MVELANVLLSTGRQRRRGTVTWQVPAAASASDEAPTAVLEFTQASSTKSITINSPDIKHFTLVDCFDGITWRLELRNGAILKFSNITSDASVKEIEALARALQRECPRVAMSTKGANFGHVQLTDNTLNFLVDSQTAFELPVHLISQAISQSRNEVALELVQDEKDGAASRGDNLYEMRLFVPDDVEKLRAQQLDREKRVQERDARREERKAAREARRMKDGDGGNGDDDDEDDGDEDDDDDEEEDDDNDDNDEEYASQMFVDEIHSRTQIDDTVSQSIGKFEKLLFNVPRGRYDVELFTSYFKLSSASYTYKIKYASVSKMFLFDSVENQQHFFVLGLNPPVRQGRTAYPYLVVQLGSNEMIERQYFKIDEKTSAEKYKGLIKPIMSGRAHDVLTHVFKGVTDKRVFVPGTAFTSTRGDQSAYVSCSYKANEGSLYMLEKSFFFLRKPPMHIRHDAIVSIEIDQMVSANKRFGIRVRVNEGEKQVDYMFTNIAREERDGLLQFFRLKNLTVIDNGGDAGGAAGNGSMVDDDDDDGDANDSYMNRLDSERRGGRGAGGGAGGAGGDGDDDSGDDESEEDEDYVASDSDGSAGSGSSSGGESGSESESDGGGRGKKKRKGGAATAKKAAAAAANKKQKTAAGAAKKKAPVKKGKKGSDDDESEDESSEEESSDESSDDESSEEEEAKPRKRKPAAPKAKATPATKKPKTDGAASAAASGNSSIKSFFSKSDA